MNGLKSTIAFGAFILLTLIMYSCSDTSTGPTCCLPPPGSQSYSHTDQPGASANDFLADSNFTVLSVEVDYMGDHKPTDAALDSLAAFLEKCTNKNKIVINEPTSISSGGQSSYTADDVRNLEEEHRNLKTENTDTLTTYILILDGEYSNGNVLGIAYYNTSVALFGETIDRVSSGVGAPPRRKIEASVLNHEFGHLFGLVNIEGSGTNMQTPHQDEKNGHHCDNDQCLMYWAVQTSDFFANLFDGSIPDLDENCIADLQANGGK